MIYVADTAVSISSPEEADNALGKCLALDPLNTFCGFERIYELAYTGKFDAAIAEYNRLRKSSNNPWLDEPAAYAELAKGNFPEARGLFRSLAEHGREGNSLVHIMAAQDGFAAAHLLKGEVADAHADLDALKDQTQSAFEKADYLSLMAEIDAFHGNPDLAKRELVDASNKSDSPEFTIPNARTYAIMGDYAAARSILARKQDSGRQPGLEYGATEYFINGLEASRKNDLTKAIEQLILSSTMHQSPETTYFLAKAQMDHHDWKEAIDSLNLLIVDRARVFTDSVASLIPLADYDLSVCYENQGNEPEARRHLAAAQTMWKEADPRLKALLMGR